MGLIISDLGADCILQAFLNNVRPAGGNNLTLKLYCNNVSLVDTLTAASFTEAVGGGYAPKTLINGNWTVNVGSDPSTGAYAQQIFTFTGPLTTNIVIYGYYVVDADNVFQWAETLPQPFTPANDGDHVDVTPKIQASKGTPAA